jgi:hypothetical protein
MRMDNFLFLFLSFSKKIMTFFGLIHRNFPSSNDFKMLHFLHIQSTTIAYSL